MSDNVAVEPSAAPTAVEVATDEIGGRHYQILKLAIGGDGVATLVDDAGLPIQAAALPLPAGAATEATLDALKAVADSLAVTAAAIQAATEALNIKAIALDTGAISGTVEVSALPAPREPAVLHQDYEAHGPMIVTPDTAQQWPVTVQGRGTDGVVRDLLTTAKGELVASATDHVTYRVAYNGTPAAGTVFIGPFDASGFVSFSACLLAGSMAGGVSVQFSLDGSSWSSLQMVNNGQSSGNAQSAFYSVGNIYSGALPPCRYIRLAASGSGGAVTGVLLALALGKTSLTQFANMRLAEVQPADMQVFGASSTIYDLLVGGIDPAKRSRPFAADSTVNVKRQGATNNATGAALNIPFYGDVLTTVITRSAVQPYGADQPAALQANTRGELSIDTDTLRRNQEQQQMLEQAVLMQSLDPNWGFELR